MEMQWIRENMETEQIISAKPTQVTVETEVALPGGLREEARVYYTDAAVQVNGAFVISYNVQFQLRVTCFLCAFNASFRHGPADTETPVSPVDTDAETCAVPHFFTPAEGVNAGGACDLAVHYGDQLQFIFTFQLFLQKSSFLIHGKRCFFRVRGKKVRLCMRQNKNIKHVLRILSSAASQQACSAVFERDLFHVFHNGCIFSLSCFAD